MGCPDPRRPDVHPVMTRPSPPEPLSRCAPHVGSRPATVARSGPARGRSAAAEGPPSVRLAHEGGLLDDARPRPVLEAERHAVAPRGDASGGLDLRGAHATLAARLALDGLEEVHLTRPALDEDLRAGATGMGQV